MIHYFIVGYNKVSRVLNVLQLSYTFSMHKNLPNQTLFQILNSLVSVKGTKCKRY